MKNACNDINATALLLSDLEKRLNLLCSLAAKLQESGIGINACGPLSRVEDLIFQAQLEVRKSIAIMREEAHA